MDEGNNCYDCCGTGAKLYSTGAKDTKNRRQTVVCKSCEGTGEDAIG